MSTGPRAIPAASAASICVRAISLLVAKAISARPRPCGVLCPQPIPRADTAGRKAASCLLRWPATSSAPPDSCRPCPTARSIAAPLPRVPAVFAMARIIDHPVTALSLRRGERRHHFAGHGRKQRAMAPVGVGHQVIHRLMRRAHILRMHSSSHELHALAAAGQHQAAQIPARRRCPICMPQRLYHRLGIAFKARSNPLPMTNLPECTTMLGARHNY